MQTAPKMSINPYRPSDPETEALDLLIHNVRQFLLHPRCDRSELRELLGELEKRWLEANTTFWYLSIDGPCVIPEDEYPQIIALILEAVADAPVKLSAEDLHIHGMIMSLFKGLTISFPEEKALPREYKKKIRKLIRARMPERFT
jgi:hypothetical protein